MNSATYKTIELVVIFIIIPASFMFSYDPKLKFAIGILGLIYVVYILFKKEKIKINIVPDIKWKLFFRKVSINLIVIALITVVYMYMFDRSNLFVVVLNKPKMWLLFVCIYSVISVYPQELLYRTFFFKRYESLVKNDRLFIIFNAIMFSIAHLLFKNVLVMVLTFLGGVLFAITYKKTKSTLLVSIEHAIYGSWLFTVGLGEILGFPV